MPYKNSLKTYLSNSYYHLYSRGINKIRTFIEDADYKYFLYLLKKYSMPDFMEKKVLHGEEVRLPVNTVSDELFISCYCLMPNHFHLLVKNIKENGIQDLMRRVLSVYVSFFNAKYGREGPLFQGAYRAVNLTSEAQLIQVSRYIHLNPFSDHTSSPGYSSLYLYQSNIKNGWLVIDPVLLKSTDWNRVEDYQVRESPDSGDSLIL